MKRSDQSREVVEAFYEAFYYNLNDSLMNSDFFFRPWVNSASGIKIC